MEMESSRRSIDRAREPVLKKSRLTVEVEQSSSANGYRDRPFPQRVSSVAGAATTGPLLSRFRANERDRDAERGDSVRGAYQQLHQELVNQYKTALAELTFNSKPIITNLTIIAGENVHAAKWIAATVSANILEVPSEQKLPSLYLLDSIVKNIGRDYIKYFATRLPEVFCKAYRMVDSSIHTGMRHLFGTWKGVFPHATLQMIEKELGFVPSINNSSSGVMASRPDSQSQHQPHSIHVNPKYLEARQRLQQSSREKGTNKDNTATMVTSAEDVERPDRTANVGSGRPWTDLPVKNFQHPPRESLSEPVHEKNTSALYGDYGYGSDLSSHSDLGTGRCSERVTEPEELDKPWYGTGSSDADSIGGQKNGFDFQHGFTNYQAPRSAQAVLKLQPTPNIANRRSRRMSENWKNSEDEEYMWDDMNSRFMDKGAPDSSRRDGWTPDDAEKLEIDPQPQNENDIGLKVNRETSTGSLSVTHRGQAAAGHQTLSMGLLQESHPVDTQVRKTSMVLDNSDSFSGLLASGSTSLARAGSRAQTVPSFGGAPSFGSLTSQLSGSAKILGQQWHQSLGPASPPRQSSMCRHPNSPSSSVVHQHQHLHKFTDEDHPQVRLFPQPGPKTSQLAGSLNLVSHIQITQDSFPILPQNHNLPGTLQNLQSNHSQLSQHVQTSSPLMSFSQQRHHIPPLHHIPPSQQQPQPEPTQSQLSSQIQKPPPQAQNFGTSHTMGFSVSSHSNISTAEHTEESTSSLLAAIMKNGLLSNNLVTGSLPNQSFQESAALPSHLNIQPPLPSGPPPIQHTSSMPMVAPASVLDPDSHGNALAITTHPQKTAVLPPLPLVPSCSPSLVSSTTSQMSNISSAIPNSLPSLLSLLVTKGLISTSTTEPSTLTTQVLTQLQNQSPSPSTSSSIPVSLCPASTTIPTSTNELPLSESPAKSTIVSKDLIGIEFRLEIIRESHPSVISSLFDDLPHRCNICGLRLKLQEQLDRHMEWHASKKPELSSCNSVSRRWYTETGNCASGIVEHPPGPMFAASMEDSLKELESSEVVVPADESQSICILCGEIFEDFYSHERDEWMFKGAVYMTMPAGEGDMGTTDKSAAQGPIVHANCISQSSVYDLGVAEHVKMDQTDDASR